jgi:hypothetical protein
VKRFRLTCGVAAKMVIDDDPLGYKEVMASINAPAWQKAMGEELAVMCKFGVYEYDHRCRVQIDKHRSEFPNGVLDFDYTGAGPVASTGPVVALLHWMMPWSPGSSSGGGPASSNPSDPSTASRKVVAR